MQKIKIGNVGTIHGQPASDLYRVLQINDSPYKLKQTLFVENIKTGRKIVISPDWFWCLLDEFTF